MFCFSNLCLCHHSIKSGSSLGHLLGQRRGGGAVPLSPRSENVSRLCSLLPFALWWNLVFAACLAMWSSYKRRRGRGRLAARICTSMRACMRACVRTCVSACVWVGRAERSHSTLERGVHTSQPRGKILHMKVQKNRSYLYFKTVNANSKPTCFFPLFL